MKEVTKSVIDEVAKRITQVSESKMHSNKKTAELALIGEQSAEKMRSHAKSLNTLKNCYAEVRKAIADLGVYNHLLPRRLKEVDAKLHSLVTLADMRRECKDDVAGFQTKLNNKVSELEAMGKQKYSDGNAERGREFFALAEEVASIKVYPESWYHFKLSKTELKSVNDTGAENLQEKLSNVVEIGVRNYIDLGMSLIRDEYYIRRALGLAMLSGRRMSEIFVSASFEAVGSDKLKFSGALKKSLEDGLKASSESHIIDSIIDANEFVHYFEIFREDEKIKELIAECESEGNYSIVNKRIGTLCGYNAKSRLSRLNPSKTNWKFSDTRSMAVAVAYFLDSKKPSGERIEDETIYYKNYLCHENVAEMLHYREFSVISDVKQKTLLERLYDAEEDVLRLSTRSEITTDRFLKVHDALCEFLAKNPDVNKITTGLIKRPKKKGGPGAAHDVAVEYFEMIRKHVC